MAVDHFELNEHPFLLTPALNEYYETDVMRSSRERLETCLRNGGGISIVTGDAGLGKTSLLYQLAGQLVPEYRVVLLKSLAYTSAEDVLKAILFELDIPYRKLTEQDLRLRLVQSAKKLKTLHEGIVILADEAHLASPTVLNELRSLTNFVDTTPLFRVLVAGQLELEEQFANREMAAFVQRISCQESLTKLTQQESMDYIDARINSANGDLEIVCEEEALQLISFAADGIPRNINQLFDCAMRMAAANGEKPISRTTAKAALDELQKLPIRWNTPTEVTAESAFTETETESDVIEVADEGTLEIGFADDDHILDSEPSTPSNVVEQKPESAFVVETIEEDEDGFAIEFGAGIDDLDAEETIETEVAEEPVEDVAEEVVSVTTPIEDAEPTIAAELEECELDIEDRYAELDYRRQQLRPVTQSTSSEPEAQPVVEEQEVILTPDSEVFEIAEESTSEEMMIEVDIQHTIAELTEAASHLLSGSDKEKVDSDDSSDDQTRFDIVLPDA